MATDSEQKSGHRNKEPPVAVIGRFQGRLINADHPDYHIARAVWNGAMDRRSSDGVCGGSDGAGDV